MKNIKYISALSLILILLLSVSCKKDNTPGTGVITNPGEGVSFDGYNYETIVLGNGQEWMAENLRTGIYANGEPIPNYTDDVQWWNPASTGAWCYYENDIQNGNLYGRLYNWHAVADTRNVCPNGWHVPTDEEWTELEDYLGGRGVAGGKMKSTGTSQWESPNEGATNESDFSGLPGGGRYDGGSFLQIGRFGIWWTSSEFNSVAAWSRDLSYMNNDSYRFSSGKNKGQCIRCIKN